MTDRTAEKRAAERRGRRAEWIAAWTLRLKGYRIIARGYRRPVGEIDLIARRGRRLSFIEVKARRNSEEALAAIRPKQRQRIARTAAAFLQQRPDLADFDISFDVLLVAPGRAPRHLRNSWRPDDSA